jgi:hypothetical protein
MTTDDTTAAEPEQAIPKPEQAIRRERSPPATGSNGGRPRSTPEC